MLDYESMFGFPIPRPAGLPQQQPIAVKPLDEKEEAGLLPRIAGSTLGGLAYVGSVLEKTLGGRAIRGGLAGKPRELLSVLPFSDTLGITDYGDRVGGRELLREYGLADSEDTWGNFAGGMATEIALDPSMYLSFGTGALTPAGQVARKAAILPAGQRARMGSTLESAIAGLDPARQAAARLAAENAAGGTAAFNELAQKPLAGLFGAGLPFMGKSAVLEGQAGIDALDAIGKVGSGIKAAHQAMEKVPVLGTAYHLAGGFAPPLIGKAGDWLYRHGGAWFDGSTLGAVTHDGQQIAREMTQDMRRAVAGGNSKIFEWGKTLEEAGMKDRGTLREMLEGVYQGAPVDPRVAGVVGEMQAARAATLAELRDRGIPLTEWEDPLNALVEHFPRQATPPAKPTLSHALGKQPVRPSDARVQQGRLDVTQGWTGATEGINRAIGDADLWQLPRDQAAQKLLSGYLGPGATADEALAKLDWIHSLDPKFRDAAIAGQEMPFFGNHPLADWKTYVQRTERMKAAADAGYKLLARKAIDASAGQAPANTVSLAKALRDAGLTYKDAATGAGAESRMLAELAGRFGQQNNLSNFLVDQATAGELTRYLSGFRTPESVNPLLKAYDSATQLFKAGVTAIFPQFHVRNALSGGWQNFQQGGVDALAATGAGKGLIAGKAVPWANEIAEYRGLSPEAATAKLAEEMAAWNIGGHVANQSRDLTGLGGVGSSLDDVLAAIPGRESKTLGSALGKFAEKDTTWNPLDIQGAGANKDLFKPVVAGRAVGDVVEGTNRSALYLSLRRQGWSPEAAAEAVIGSHFDYTGSRLSDVEKTVMRRLIPFYSFTRGNLPLTVGNMVTNPGGPAGLYAKASLDLRDDSRFLPPYLGSGLAAPIGTPDEQGMQRYLTRLDMPPEQAGDLIKPGGLAGMAGGLLSQLNPIPKTALELASGKQFFTGRDLEDLHTMTGSTVADQVIMNSPLSRIVTTLRTLADERKYQDPYALPLNLLTGMKVSDVDAEKYKTIAEREYIEDMLRGRPGVGNFETTVIRPEALQDMTPEQFLLARLQKTIESRARKESAEKKAKEKIVIR